MRIGVKAEEKLKKQQLTDLAEAQDKAKGEASEARKNAKTQAEADLAEKMNKDFLIREAKASLPSPLDHDIKKRLDLDFDTDDCPPLE